MSTSPAVEPLPLSADPPPAPLPATAAPPPRQTLFSPPLAPLSSPPPHHLPPAGAAATYGLSSAEDAGALSLHVTSSFDERGGGRRVAETSGPAPSPVEGGGFISRSSRLAGRLGDIDSSGYERGGNVRNDVWEKEKFRKDDRSRRRK